MEGGGKGCWKRMVEGLVELWKQGHHHHHITSHRELAWNGNWFIVYRLAGSMDGHGWAGARETLVSGSLGRWNGVLTGYGPGLCQR